MKRFLLLFILIPNISIAESMHMIGEKGNLEVFLSALIGSAFVTILVSEIENAQS